MFAAALVVASRLLDWWPCDTACSGGEEYQRWLGIPVLPGALIGYLVSVALLLIGPAWRATVRVLWMLAGISGFHVVLMMTWSWWCPFCLVVHGLVIGGAMVLGPWRRWPWLIAIAVLAGLGYGGLHRLGVPTDHPPVEPATVSDGSLTASRLARIDAHRAIGPLTAAFRVDVVFSPVCTHCAERLPGLVRELDRAANDGRARIILRALPRSGEPATERLGRWLLAAAEESPARYRLGVLELAGIRSDLERPSLINRFPAWSDLDARSDNPLLIELQRRDRQDLRMLRADRTVPQVIIRRDGVEIARFSGTFTAEAIMASIR